MAECRLRGLLELLHCRSREARGVDGLLGAALVHSLGHRCMQDHPTMMRLLTYWKVEGHRAPGSPAPKVYRSIFPEQQAKRRIGLVPVGWAFNLWETKREDPLLLGVLLQTEKGVRI